MVPGTGPPGVLTVSWTEAAVTGLEKTALTLVLTGTLDDDGMGVCPDTVMGLLSTVLNTASAK